MPSVSSVGKVVTYGPHPSLDVIKNWKSIVELVLRAVAAVSYNRMSMLMHVMTCGMYICINHTSLIPTLVP